MQTRHNVGAASRTLPPSGSRADERLSETSHAAVNRYVEACVTGEYPTTSAERRALDVLAADLSAEARGVDARRAERLIIALHGSWPSLPAVSRLVPIDRRGTMLDSLVATCITAFYGPRSR